MGGYADLKEAANEYIQYNKEHMHRTKNEQEKQVRTQRIGIMQECLSKLSKLKTQKPLGR